MAKEPATTIHGAKHLVRADSTSSTKAIMEMYKERLRENVL